MAKNEDSLLYTPIQNLDNCKAIDNRARICPNLLPYPIDSDAICEAQLLKPMNQLPRTCQTSVLFAKDYGVHEIGLN